MPTRRIPRRGPVLTAVALAALPAIAFVAPGQAVASAPPPAATATASPVGFVNLPTSPLPSDRTPHRFTVSYRNPSPTDRTVAPQVLVESPDQGPFLVTSDIRLELLGSDGRWRVVPLGSQTGTLFTSLTSAKIVLHGHHTLTQHYRLTVLAPAHGTVEPRIALYS
ncbi:signal peptide protein [Streptomyces sp. SP17BM10]|uniref:signal peptide protein n=1 Tax=Streptomyces sp. SP17BM10 TaxID=3002530 RepID=UPI002E789903|nr:signal peptide protein [Streptomyces sp. SP17BM10]MEE1788462.1 signal peptide protein [Streptomyces sp. SP17BM10]